MLRNNAYTNVLAAWVLARAAETVDLLTGRDCVPLWRRLDIRPGELEHWERVSRRMRVPFHEGVISQFEGYESLQELDWDGYRERYGNIGRMDLILQAEGDSTNRYKLSKQADVLMLFCLFSAEELRELFDQMGYSLDRDLVRADGEVLRGADDSRLDAEQGHAQLGVGPERLRPVVVVVQGGSEGRPPGHPGRNDA